MTIDANEILSVTKSVTKEWTKQQSRRPRPAFGTQPRLRLLRPGEPHRSGKPILPGAYAHASGNGRYSVSKRQLYYASRDKFRELTGREIEAQYFSQTLLVQYQNRQPEETAHWKITADPPGTLTIPNASHQVRARVAPFKSSSASRRQAAP